MAALRSFWRRMTFGSFADENREKVDEQRENVQDSFTNILGPFESHVVCVQSILIWEKPVVSALTFLLCNALFWIIVNCQCRFYFSLGTLAAFVFVSRTWVNQIWPEIRVPVPEGEDTEEWTPVNPQVLSVPEISHYLQEMWKTSKEWGLWLIDLRHNQPGMFCILLTCFLASTAVIGHYISGVFISYILMTAIMLGPGFLVHVYPHISNLVSSEPFLITSSNTKLLGSPHVPLSESDELDEFLPEPSHETLEALSCALDSQETDYEESLMIASKDLGLEDFISNEGEDFTLQTGLVDLPPHDRDSEDDDEFVGSLDHKFEESETRNRPRAMEPLMQFVSRHFNGDSDESEEERLATGLDFAIANESSNDSIVEREGVSNLTVSMPSPAYPTFLSGDGHTMAKSVGDAAQLLTDQNFSDKVPKGSDSSSDMSNSGNGQSEIASSYFRQLSTQSDADLSDFEIVSESEFS